MINCSLRLNQLEQPQLDLSTVLKNPKVAKISNELKKLSVDTENKEKILKLQKELIIELTKMSEKKEVLLKKKINVGFFQMRKSEPDMVVVKHPTGFVKRISILYESITNLPC